MTTYLGETPIDIALTEYSDYTPKDWAMLYILKYGAIDGAHHKDWLLDQIARVLNGAVPGLLLRKWSDGQEELQLNELGSTPEYEAFVLQCQDPDEDGITQYEYNPGIAP